MPSCIYCGFTGTLSEEHWFPEAFGKFKNFELLKDRVCAECNGASKVAEQALVRYGVTGIYRAMTGNKGRRRTIGKKSPFYWPLKNLPPLELKASFEGLPCTAYGEFAEDGTLQAARQLIVRRGSEIYAVLLPEWVQSPVTLERYLRRSGNAGVTVLKVVGTPKVAAETGRRLFPSRQAEVEVRKPESKVHFVWSAFTGELHARAICKIAFHYLLKYWGRTYSGLEPEFQAIRDFIQGKHAAFSKGKDWRQYARCERDGLKVVGGLSESYCHTLMLHRGDRQIEARLRFFLGGPDSAMQWTWKVNLGRSPGKVIWVETLAHYFILYPQKQGPWNGELLKGEGITDRRTIGTLPSF